MKSYSILILSILIISSSSLENNNKFLYNNQIKSTQSQTPKPAGDIIQAEFSFGELPTNNHIRVLNFALVKSGYTYLLREFETLYVRVQQEKTGKNYTYLIRVKNLISSIQFLNTGKEISSFQIKVLTDIQATEVLYYFNALQLKVIMNAKGIFK